MMKSTQMISASLGLGALAATARFGAFASELKPYALSGHALGASVSLLVLHADAGRAQAALADALAEVQAVDAIMSLYRDDSQLVKLNRVGELARPDWRLLDVLLYSQELSDRTQGAFDVTVQPLWNAFTQAKELGGLPEPAALAEARALVDWQPGPNHLSLHA